MTTHPFYLNTLDREICRATPQRRQSLSAPPGFLYGVTAGMVLSFLIILLAGGH